MALPKHARLRPTEVLLLVLGVLTWGALGVLWMRVLPALIELRELDLALLAPGTRLVTHLGFQIPVLGGVMLLLAAGAAGRVSGGEKWASKVMAVGCGLAFGSLLLTANVFYEPLLNGPAAEGAGAQEAAEEAPVAETGPVDWGE